MKVTKKSIKHEVETTEAVCEITQSEFEQTCAKVAAKTITDFVGEDAGIDDVMMGIAMTSVFADFVARLVGKLFNDKTETHDKKEEK
jgi:hypothetical protein